LNVTWTIGLLFKAIGLSKPEFLTKESYLVKYYTK
jgi:hypothetical protein